MQIFNKVWELIEANRPPQIPLTEEMLESECVRLNIPFEKMSTNASDYDGPKIFYRLESEEAYTQVFLENTMVQYQCFISDGVQAVCLDDSGDAWDWPNPPSDQLISDSKNSLIYRAFLATTTYDLPGPESLFSNLQKIVSIDETVKIVDVDFMTGGPIKYVLLQSEVEEFFKLFK